MASSRRIGGAMIDQQYIGVNHPRTIGLRARYSITSMGRLTIL
jgi:hypothetical protein